MDGVHDIGGKDGYGPVEVEKNEPAFHDRWEASVFSMMLAASRSDAWHNADQFRHGIERIDPVVYLTHGYYGRWLAGIETLLVEAGLVETETVTTRALALGAAKGDRIGARPGLPGFETRTTDQRSAQRGLTQKPKYSNGDRIRTHFQVPTGHTRLPAYARGREGVIQDCHGGWVYPDTNAHGRGEQPCHLYSVRFASQELYGADAESFSVYLDLFEPYLEHCPGAKT